MNHKKILIFLAVVLIIGVVVLFVVSAAKAKAAAAAKGTANPQPQAQTQQTQQQQVPSQNNDYPVMYGVKSEAAKQLQVALGVVADGIIGQKTLAALQRYVPTATTSFQIKTPVEMSALIQKIQGTTPTPTAATPPFVADTTVTNSIISVIPGFSWLSAFIPQ